ncbi:MAG: FAD-dependent oxidoreductase [Bryobacteraceae bacterium]
MTSSDPVVRDFFLSRQIADISGPWRPGSIRDQILRARMVVDRALANGWISPQRPVAVLGAGIAGITAAVVARTAGVSVTIFEKDKPAAAQSRSFRWVDPAAYDWPHPWWGSGEMVWDHGGRWPLRLEAGEGRTLAFQFASLLRKEKNIRYVRENVTGLAQEKDRIRVATNAGLVEEFALVVDCRGAGKERSCGDFETIPFWSGMDPRRIVAGKAAELGRPVRVLISGGGDGAIQDFLLLATGRASIAQLAVEAGLARDVLRTGLTPISGSLAELAGFEREALSIEERCWRDFCWQGPPGTEAGLTSCLAEFYEGWVARLADRWKPLPANRTPIEFTLVRTAGHYSVCYPLNRLIGMVAERQFRPKVVVGRLEALYKPTDFDLSLIRHGIETSAPPFGVRRQIFPFQ